MYSAGSSLPLRTPSVHGPWFLSLLSLTTVFFAPGPAECMICWEHSSLPFFWEPVLKPGGFNFQQHHLLMLLKYLHTTHVSIQDLHELAKNVKIFMIFREEYISVEENHCYTHKKGFRY